MIRATLAAVVLLVHTAPALADPVTLTTTAVGAVLTGIGVTGTAASIAASVISAAIVAGVSYGLSVLTAPGAPKIDPGKGREMFEAAEASEVRALGRVRLGGAVAFGATKEDDKFRLVLSARAFDGFESFFLGGFEVVRDDAGAVLSKPYRILTTNYIHLKTDLGDPDKTAWSDLTAAFPALWTADHRVRGIAQTLVRYVSPGLTDSKFLRLYQGGPPALEVLARGERVYDPRLAGSPGQDPDDSSTWAWADNGVLCALHMLLSFPRFAHADVDLDQVAGEADRADAVVATLLAPGSPPTLSSEVRARAWGIWPSEGPRGDILAQLLRSIGAELFTTAAGKIGIQLVDDVRVPTLTIPTRHIVRLDWRSGPESVERPNRCRLKYYSPERNFELAEIDLTDIAWASVPDEIDAVGEQVADIELPFCPSASQAQRIGRRLFAMARADVGIAVTNMVGMAAWGQKVIALEVDDLDTTLTVAIAPPRCRDRDGLVEIPFVVIPALPEWDPATDEAAAPAEVPAINYAAESDAPPAPLATCVVTYPGGAKETRWSATLSTTGGYVPSLANYEPAWRKGGATPSEWRQAAIVGPPNVAGGATLYTDADLTGEIAEARVRGSNTDDEVTAWSPTFSAVAAEINTTPAAPTKALEESFVFFVPPADLHVAYLRVVKPDTSVELAPCRPLVGIPYPDTPGYSVTAHTSDGTSSTAVTH